MNLSFNLNKATQISPGVYSTSLEGLWYLPLVAHPDNRGFYAEVTRIPEIEAVLKKPFTIKQINHSHSKEKVIRGFHAENWNKLISIVHGTCFCALADVRPQSPTFGQVETFFLGGSEDQPSGESKDSNTGALQGSLFVSSGIANSFCVLKGPADYLYFVDELYSQRDPSGDVAISLFDPDLGVEWPLSREELIVSDRDRNAVTLREKFPTNFIA